MICFISLSVGVILGSRINEISFLIFLLGSLTPVTTRKFPNGFPKLGIPFLNNSLMVIFLMNQVMNQVIFGKVSS